VILYLVYRYWKQHELPIWQKMTLVLMVSTGVLIFINFLLGYVIDSFLESYRIAEVIYPKISLFMKPPEQFRIPDPDHLPLVRFILVYIYQPVYMLKLTLLKAVLFLAHAKPYYSWGHNLLIMIYLYPSYVFMVKGLPGMRNDLKVFIIIFILIQFGLVALTSENWDGRFLLPLLPLMFGMAGGGLRYGRE
jgi:hypothetical protein